MRGDKACASSSPSSRHPSAHVAGGCSQGLPPQGHERQTAERAIHLLHLLEHIRIAQWDIIDFIRNPDYEELEWPRGYWPAKNAKATKKDWDETIARYQSDLKEDDRLVRNPRTDLHAKDPARDGQDDSPGNDSHRRPQRLPHRGVRHTPAGREQLEVEEPPLLLP